MAEPITFDDTTIYHVYLIADGTGVTAENLLNAVLTQFKKRDLRVSLFNNVRTDEKLQHILELAEKDKPFLLYTLVSKQHRAMVYEFAQKHNFLTVDVLGPILKKLAETFGVRPEYLPGLFHGLNEEYFKRVEAVEFAVKNDDGKNPNSLKDAEIVLVGVSRTSKTPLSIYLAGLGYKVANIPLVKGIEPPKELFEINQRKIFGLIISLEKLKSLRQERLKRLNQTDFTDYADESYIFSELENARDLFKKNKKWVVIDVSTKSVEETAAEILTYVRKDSNIRSL
ncbi:kinase/pyrophosphorylase [bacterium]|nr:kinase/pyrophosphorylase [bacterium]